MKSIVALISILFFSPTFADDNVSWWNRNETIRQIPEAIPGKKINTKKSVTPSKEKSFALVVQNIDGMQTLELRSLDACYKISYNLGNEDILSCGANLKISYEILDCSTQKVLEKNTSDGNTLCEKPGKVSLHFDTKNFNLVARLRTRKQKDLTRRYLSGYIVENPKNIISTLSKAP